MASETYFTPLAPVRWCHLITARTQLDETKPKAWTCELVLSPATDAKHKAFMDKLEAIFTETHGVKKRRSDKGLPWKADKDDASKVVVKFKTLQFVNDDGTTIKGPQILDSKRQAWGIDAIGNGSEIIVKFVANGWERPEGVGLSLRPRAAQVVTFVPREDEDATDGFGEVEGGYVVGSTPEYVDEFASDEEPPF